MIDRAKKIRDALSDESSNLRIWHPNATLESLKEDFRRALSPEAAERLIAELDAARD